MLTTASMVFSMHVWQEVDDKDEISVPKQRSDIDPWPIPHKGTLKQALKRGSELEVKLQRYNQLALRR